MPDVSVMSRRFRTRFLRAVAEDYPGASDPEARDNASSSRSGEDHDHAYDHDSPPHDHTPRDHEDDDGDGSEDEDASDLEEDQGGVDFGVDDDAFVELAESFYPMESEHGEAPIGGGPRPQKRWEEIESNASSPLYPSALCSVLACTMMLLDWQAEYRVSNVAMDKLLSILSGKLLPPQNRCPPSRLQAKKVLVSIGMDYKMIHACPNDCILYDEEYADLEACPKPRCGEARYRDDVQGKNVPRKVKNGSLQLIYPRARLNYFHTCTCFSIY